MRRREFLSLVGAAAAWPVPASGQQSAELPMVGFLGAPTPLSWSPFVASFEKTTARAIGVMPGPNVLALADEVIE